MYSLCHPWVTTTNLSYRFPIFETSATALCGTTGRYSSWRNGHLLSEVARGSRWILVFAWVCIPQFFSDCTSIVCWIPSLVVKSKSTGEMQLFIGQISHFRCSNPLFLLEKSRQKWVCLARGVPLNLWIINFPYQDLAIFGGIPSFQTPKNALFSRAWRSSLRWPPTCRRSGRAAKVGAVPEGFDSFRKQTHWNMLIYHLVI